MKISEECKRALFEVLSIYNGENLVEQKTVEEEFYNRGTEKFSNEKAQFRFQSTWK
jgi:hypothetical protein